MSETPITPANEQESPDNVVYTNFGREQHPGQFFNDAERGVQEARVGSVLDLGQEDRPDPALWQTPEAPAPQTPVEIPVQSHEEQLMESARSAGPDACVRYIESLGSAIHSGLREAS